MGALRRLSASFGLAWISITLFAGPGPAAWVLLTGDATQAGVFFALFSVSTAIGAVAGGRAMDLWGRGPVLTGAHLLAGTGYTIAGIAYMQRSLPLFAAGIFASACASGMIYLTRVAAAELFPQTERAQAVARVQVSATIGAIAGPLLLVFSGPLSRAINVPALELIWFIAFPLFLLSAFLVPRTRLPRPTPAPIVTGPAPSIPGFPLATGIVALISAQAAMVSVMGIAGVALSHMGHGTSTLGVVMALHFVGMFGLSLVVGKFADRAGRRPTILTGLGILAIGGLVTAFVGGAVGLGLGLLLIGLGWSFAYIGGTVVLADVIPAARRARIVGRVDFSTAILAGTAAYAGGQWYAGRGLSGLGLFAIALVAIPAVLAFTLREPRSGAYGSTPAVERTGSSP